MQGKLVKKCVTGLAMSIISAHSMAYAAIGTTTLLTAYGTAFPYDYGSFGVSLSADGRFAAYLSDFTAPNGVDTYSDLFVYDTVSGKSSRITANYNHSIQPSPKVKISADGFAVAFESDAADLVTGDVNQVNDVFVYDRRTQKTSRVSVSSSGVDGNDHSRNPSISADGRYIAFESFATNLTDKPSFNDIFVHDRLTKQTSLLSVKPDGTGGTQSTSPSINADGRYVAFSSNTRLVNTDTNFHEDIYLRDRVLNQTTWISVNSSGNGANFRSLEPSISANGRFIAFESEASNLVPDDTNGSSDIFVRDRILKKTTRVSVNTNGLQGNNRSTFAAISANGRYVAFTSRADNLVIGDTNGSADVFVHDRETGRTSRVSIGADGSQADFTFLGSLQNSLSADGRYAGFESDAGNLVTGGAFGRNVFVRDRWLNAGSQSDLQITATLKPASVVKNNSGSFVFTVTNNGPATTGTLAVQHLLTNGQLVNLTPSKGTCKRYSSLTLCSSFSLSAGSSYTLNADINALRTPLRQQLSVYSGGNADPKPANNYLSVATPVTP